jgi:hypothetical protein
MSEWSVNISLVSDVEDAFTKGDNSGIVATDTCKNTVSTNHSAVALWPQIPKRVCNVRAYDCLFCPRSQSQMYYVLFRTYLPEGKLSLQRPIMSGR